MMKQTKMGGADENNNDDVHVPDVAPEIDQTMKENLMMRRQT